MGAEELAAFLHGQRVGVLATVDDRGCAHAAPVWLLFEDADLYVETGRTSRKAVNLRSNPSYALVAGLDVWGPCVVLLGNAEEVQDERLRAAIRQVMAIRFYGSRAHPSFKRMEQQFHQYGGASVFRLIPSSVVSWDYAKAGSEDWILPWAPA
jgi:nitroimidazol reductase NimA-like FMN-containing flavoprotein (pyridoxamine 5'-phosphate oxidase superfamily)